MKKILFISVLILCWSVFKKIQTNHSLNGGEQTSRVANKKNSILKQHDFQQAIEKMVRKNKKSSRHPSSTFFSETIGRNHQAQTGIHFDEIKHMSLPELEKEIVLLEHDIKADERMIDLMEADHDLGLNVSLQDIDAVIKHSKYKKEKLEFFVNHSTTLRGD